MIGTIRKHSAWLWMIIIVATIISFVFWNAAPATRGGDVGSGYGTMYGQTITPADFKNAQNEVRFFYFLHYGTWPEHNANVTPAVLEQETYKRILMVRKAASLHVQVDEDAMLKGANQLLSSPGLLRMFRTQAKSIPMDQFVKNILDPNGLTVDDFQHYIHDDIAIQQLVRTFGAPGEVITPQEAGMFYDRENQEVSAQIVMFSASNYLGQVKVTDQAVGQFYTNYMAAYRLPDRVQVKYVEFAVSNNLAQAKTELSTNLDAQVSNVYAQYGMSAFPEAKSEVEAKNKIRDALIRQRATALTRLQANELENVISSVNSSNQTDILDQAAQQKNVKVKLTAPFGAEYGPEEFFAPEELTKTAFQLNADTPISSPIAGTDAYYIIELAKQLPSEIPPFAQIQPEVRRDFQQHAAAEAARIAGTNFASVQLPVQLATGKKFPVAAANSGYTPEVLPSFAISTQNLPGFEQRDELSRLKQVAFNVQPGHASPFIATPEGGYVLYVDSLLPVDEAKKKTDLAEFTETLRRNRENEAFNQWLMVEANRELKTTALAREQASRPTAAAQ